MSKKGPKFWDKILMNWRYQFGLKTKYTFPWKRKLYSVNLSAITIESMRLGKENTYCGLMTLNLLTCLDSWDELPFNEDSMLKKYGQNILDWVDIILPNEPVVKVTYNAYRVTFDGGPAIQLYLKIRFNNDKKSRESFTEASMRLFILMIQQMGLFRKEVSGLSITKETYVEKTLTSELVSLSEFLETEYQLV